jgi:archaellum component FlaF (FlaF/FlaG flagellin family)
MDSSLLAKIVAKGIFYASIQASIGSVEMSSKFSVMNFSKDQETLQRAADALKSYTIVGFIWTVGSVLTLYSSYGWFGAVVGLVSNLVMMGWMVGSYISAFKEAADRYDLKTPQVYTQRDWMLGAASIITVSAGLVGLNFLNGNK